MDGGRESYRVEVSSGIRAGSRQTVWNSRRRNLAPITRPPPPPPPLPHLVNRPLRREVFLMYSEDSELGVYVCMQFCVYSRGTDNVQCTYAYSGTSK